jgi:hypothetical protein
MDMTQDINTSAEETHVPAEKKAVNKVDKKEAPLESAPTEWIVRKSDGRMVVTDF